MMRRVIRAYELQPIPGYGFACTQAPKLFINTMKILADASLPYLTQFFPPPFELRFYHSQAEIPDRLSQTTILLCRSTLSVNKDLLHPHALQIVASASSGIDHIDSTYLHSRQITVLDAKGSNAQSVADYVLASLAYLQTAENFKGKSAGIIGFGKVGQQVAYYLQRAGFDIHCYDPPKSQREPGFQSCSLQTVLACDLVCLHANLHDEPPYPSRHLLGKQELACLKPHTAIINASRGNIVCEEALLQLTTPIFYCTDVFAEEPAINPHVIEQATLCTPHIAGHSIEAKLAAIMMISQKLHHYYQLTPPLFPPLSKPYFLEQTTNWQNRILPWYNPQKETLTLKKAVDKRQAFLEQRKAHNSRHDFAVYSEEEALSMVLT